MILLNIYYGAPLWTISVTNCRCDVYAFNLRWSMCRPSMIDVSTFQDRVSTFQDRWSMCRPSKIDVSTFEDRCVDLRRSMYRPSKIDGRCVDLQKSTFENRWLMCWSSKIDVSTFEHRWSMWNYAAILAKNIDTIVVCELRRGFALQCFHYYCIANVATVDL